LGVSEDLVADVLVDRVTSMEVDGPTEEIREFVL